MSDDVIMEAVGVSKRFGGGNSWLSRSRPVQAVDNVSLQVRRGETFAIVGESGCGKSTLARVLMRLLDPSDGNVLFEGRDVSHAEGADLRNLRGDVQFIFQDPFSSLNPRMTVGQLVGEPLEVHAPQLSKAERRERTESLLAQVGLRPEHAARYPHEFSGGQRQRIGIARALAAKPKLLIGDEPVSALDVSVQAQVINLLADLSQDLGLTLVIIAHDLGVIRHMSDRVAVMYLGRIVEMGPTQEVFTNPKHPYTRALLEAIPTMDTRRQPRETKALGEMPSPTAPPPGCRFHTRCHFAQAVCKSDIPELGHTGSQAHSAACHLWSTLPEPQAKPAPQPRTPAAAKRFELYRAATAGGVVMHKKTQQQRGPDE